MAVKTSAHPPGKSHGCHRQIRLHSKCFCPRHGTAFLKNDRILCADSSDLFLAKAVYFLEQELQANGYESLLCCTGYNPDIKKNYLNLILSKKVDSIILVGSHFIGFNEDENQYIKDVSTQIPIMLLNASFDHPNVYSTLCDDYGTMFEAATEMIQSGITISCIYMIPNPTAV